MNSVEQAIKWLCQVILWISTSVIFVILVGNTVVRYATGASMQWGNEVPEMLFPWMVMAGVVLASQRGAHITTVFLVEKLPESVRRLVGVLGWLVVAGLYGTLARATYQMLEIVHDERSPILQIPGSVTYGCVMVGMALLCLQALIAAARVYGRSPAAGEAPAGEGNVPAAHW